MKIIPYDSIYLKFGQEDLVLVSLAVGFSWFKCILGFNAGVSFLKKPIGVNV